MERKNERIELNWLVLELCIDISGMENETINVQKEMDKITRREFSLPKPL